MSARVLQYEGKTHKLFCCTDPDQLRKHISCIHNALKALPIAMRFRSVSLSRYWSGIVPESPVDRRKRFPLRESVVHETVLVEDVYTTCPYLWFKVGKKIGDERA